MPRTNCLPNSFRYSGAVLPWTSPARVSQNARQAGCLGEFSYVNVNNFIVYCSTTCSLTVKLKTPIIEEKNYSVFSANCLSLLVLTCILGILIKDSVTIETSNFSGTYIYKVTVSSQHQEMIFVNVELY